MASNTEIEMRWVDAWNNLLDLVVKGREIGCQLPDGSVVSVEDCLGWIQDSVYEGCLVRVESGWINGREGIIIHRWRDSRPS